MLAIKNSPQGARPLPPPPKAEGPCLDCALRIAR